MASRPKTKMSVADRAKQFAPFSALKGLEEALKEKERILVERAELSEDSAAELSGRLSRIKKGMKIKVVYYSGGEYVSEEGMVTRIDEIFRKLTVVKTEINMDDIIKITGEGLLVEECADI